jgi:5-methylcytosine-specific restriction endonuclease McrA
MNTPFRHERRKQLTPMERAKIFAAAGGRCASCTRKLGPSDDWDIDHAIALENGGTNDDANLQVLCDWCHTPKTADDHRTASKSKRIYTRQVVPGRFRRSKSWR